ncbi:MAG TPA: PilZ domain-containing protein [Polyangiaceae bacterium]|nr:PilZ domain-containing protein [Polyangiaceae bacterium]
MTQARDRGGDPAAGPPAGHATRRKAGARRNVSTRIHLSFKGRQLQAWVLNVSRGGMRLLLETPLAAGDEFEALVPVGDELEGEPVRRPVRVVWADRQADGTFAGVEFLDVRSSVRAPVARDLSLEATVAEPSGVEASGAPPSGVEAGAAPPSGVEAGAAPPSGVGAGAAQPSGAEATAARPGGPPLEGAAAEGGPGEAPGGDAFGRPTPRVPPPNGWGDAD